MYPVGYVVPEPTGSSRISVGDWLTDRHERDEGARLSSYTVPVARSGSASGLRLLVGILEPVGNVLKA